MKARITWRGEVSFAADSGSGHTIVLDGAPEAGGRNQGPRPMELVLLGLGGCTAFDVVTILRKARQDIVDCVVELEAERAAEAPKVFTRIHVHFVVSGKKLDPKKVERAIELSSTKYCSATAMLRKTAQITHDFELIDVS